MNQPLHVGSQSLLEDSFPDPFTALWAIESKWVEPYNRRRGGWSGAKRVTIPDGIGPEISLFVKQHENHTFRCWRNGFRSQPTLDREAAALSALNGVHVPDLLYYEKRCVAGKWRAVLALPDLLGYRSLWDLTVAWKTTQWPTVSVRRQISSAIGEAIGEVHRAGWRHGHFHPKHVMLRLNGTDVDVCFVDLEKARPIKKQRHTRDIVEDLGALFRRTRHATLFDRAAFMKSYCQCERLGPAERVLMKRISAST